MAGNWTDDDRRWAGERGVALEELDQQIELANAGVVAPEMTGACVSGNGIEALDPDAADAGRIASAAGRLAFFVPASGAASRMFKAVVQAKAAGFESDSALADAVAGEHGSLASALEAFRGRGNMAVGLGLTTASLGETLAWWIDEMRLPELPKGLVPFHRYGVAWRTAAEEQALESADVLGEGSVRLHFTVPAGREALFERAVGKVADRLSSAGTPVTLTMSVQHPATDTLALTSEGEVFRRSNGEPLMRPGGHGALLRNLDELAGDVVLVKNIDNVVRDEHRGEVVRWRRALLDRLLALEAEVHRHLRSLDEGADGTEALAFAQSVFGSRPIEGTPAEQARYALARPLRVCGVVRNEGQPGGGPFWIRGADGSHTPQIVESAQMNLDDPAQREAFEGATHFNPVDIVASLRDPNGTPYPLFDFVDDRAWLLASKTHEGRPLKALERPGLWNGSMAGWNTVFAEMPSHTFRPVKQLADLLLTGHAPNA